MFDCDNASTAVSLSETVTHPHGVTSSRGISADSLTISPPVLHPAEHARLRALHALDILDTAPEPEFDDLVQLAAAICDAPMSAISLVDQHRQWFKASAGLDVSETPREIAFCQHTIQQREVMVVEDASTDPRFQQNPLVTGDMGLRFYAGVPLQTAEGHAIGSLCVLDRTPRSLTSHQYAALRILASQVNARFELRNQRRALEQALQEAQTMRARAEALERRFQLFMDSGPFLAFLKDAESRIVWCNQPLAGKLSILQNWSLPDNSLPERLMAEYRAHDLEVLRTGQWLSFFEEMAEADGSTRNLRAYKFPCTDESGQTLVGGISVDVTDDLRRQSELKRYQADLEKANQQLERLASLDSLTQVPNRRVFDEKLRVCFEKSRAENTPLAVLMLDVDHFKSHNDRFGHNHGDDVLRTLAQQLKSNLRAGDIVARYGGEEFVVVLPDTDEQSALHVARRLVVAIRQHHWPVAPVTVSIGVSQLTQAACNPECLTAWADQALYAAKRDGRDRFVSYTPLAPLPVGTADDKIGAQGLQRHES